MMVSSSHAHASEAFIRTQHSRIYTGTTRVTVFLGVGIFATKDIPAAQDSAHRLSKEDRAQRCVGTSCDTFRRACLSLRILLHKFTYCRFLLLAPQRPSRRPLRSNRTTRSSTLSAASRTRTSMCMRHASSTWPCARSRARSASTSLGFVRLCFCSVPWCPRVQLFFLLEFSFGPPRRSTYHG